MVESAVESSIEVVADLSNKVPIRVLHVDDEAGLLKVAKKCLEMQGGFEVETAVSVEEAMEKMKKKTFDVIVSDYVMPGKDGLEFLKELRDSGNNISFIMFTGKGREEVAMKALNLGADQYLNKTGDPETVYGELAHSVYRTVSRKRAEEMLRRSEEKYRNLFENAKDVIVLIDLKGNITAINKAAVEYGFKKDEVIGKNMRRFVSKRYWPRLLKELVQLARGKTVEGKIKINTPRGKKDAEYRSNPMIMNNKVVGVQTILRDITERRRAEERIRESGEKYRTLMDDAPIAIFNVNLKGKITYVNKRFEEDTGYSREEILGKNAFKLNIVSDETLKFLAKRMKALLMGKPARRVEVQFRCKDGRWIWAEMESRIIKKLGIPVGFQITGRDITERKHAEETLRKSEEKLSALNIYSRRLNTAESMEKIYQLTLDAMEKTLGFEIAFFMIVDKNMLRVVDQRGYPRSLSIKLPLNGAKKGVSVKTARTGKSINVPDAGKEEDWVEFWPSIRSGLDVPVKIGHKVLGVIGVDSKQLNAFDEKDQKLLEILASHAATAISNLEYAKNLQAYAKEIRESQKKFERLFMNNPGATVYLSPGSHIVDINSRFSEVFGYSLAEIKGKHINDVVVPEDKMEEAEMLSKKLPKGHAFYDTVRKRKDGTLVPVLISGSQITVKDQLIGIVVVYKDVSQLKRTEKALKETLEKLRVVGRLTRHDVRNKLSAVTGNVYLAKKKLPRDHEALEYLSEIEPAIRQVQKIFDFTRTYEKLGVERLAYMNVEKNVKEAVSLFSDLHGIKMINDSRGLTVLADSLLRQLFYNLIDNSLKYGEKVSRIRIYYKEVGKDQLKLVCEDDGVGILEAEKEKIFKEGYGKGTGYGLYLIRKICQVYGWTIQETGKHEEGAQFTITIPKVNMEGKILYKLH